MGKDSDFVTYTTVCLLHNHGKDKLKKDTANTFMPIISYLRRFAQMNWMHAPHL